VESLSRVDGGRAQRGSVGGLNSPRTSCLVLARADPSIGHAGASHREGLRRENEAVDGGLGEENEAVDRSAERTRRRAGGDGVRGWQPAGGPAHGPLGASDVAAWTPTRGDLASGLPARLPQLFLQGPGARIGPDGIGARPAADRPGDQVTTVELDAAVVAAAVPARRVGRAGPAPAGRRGDVVAAMPPALACVSTASLDAACGFSRRSGPR